MFTPYLTFPGNCRQALNFYQTCFNAELQLQTVAESPLADKMPAQMGSLILHATLQLKDQTIMASDMVPEGGLIVGNNVSIVYNCESEKEIQSLYEILSKNGVRNHAIETTFWGALFGDLTDKYGIHWFLNFEQKQKK